MPKNGMATVVVEVAYTKQFTNVETSDVRVRAIPGAVTVLPPIITVVLAIATRNVLVSLFSGVWVAAFFIHSCAPPLLLAAWLRLRTCCFICNT